jgi:dihydrofolate reductase
MGQIIYAMSVSLDGFIAAADGDIAWAAPDEELHQHFNEMERAIDLHLYGRRLYENMAVYWPTADENPAALAHEIAYARLWKTMPKVVFSRTLAEVAWNSRLVREDVAAEAARLKAQPGITMSVGGAGLAASFMRLGLIDEYRLYLCPVVLGGGTAMFAALLEPVRLELAETRRFGQGVVLLRYRRAGPD